VDLLYGNLEQIPVEHNHIRVFTDLDGARDLFKFHGVSAVDRYNFQCGLEIHPLSRSQHALLGMIGIHSGHKRLQTLPGIWLGHVVPVRALGHRGAIPDQFANGDHLFNALCTQQLDKTR
jgi:hypothetical protein